MPRRRLRPHHAIVVLYGRPSFFPQVLCQAVSLDDLLTNPLVLGDELFQLALDHPLTLFLAFLDLA